MNGQWSSKREVLNDLAAVTGSSNEVNDVTTVTMRPPLYRGGEDEEALEFAMYNGVKPNHQPVLQQEQPDLEGIERYIKLVNEYDSKPRPVVQDTTNKSDIILELSKLNPNVTEFIPTNSKSSKTSEVSCSNNNSEHISKLAMTPQCETAQTFQSVDVKRVTENVNDIMQKKKIDIEKIKELKPNEIDCIAKTLKSKIASGSFDSKLQKNVALISLTKLYGASSHVPTTQLLTPQYFENTEEENIEQEPKASSECDVDPTIDPPPNIVKESIKKVENWLEPKKHKLPGVQLTPTCAFRKRNPVASKESNSPVQSKSPVSTPSTSISTFVPSGYAGQLYEKFRKQAETQERNNKTIWSNVEEEMKKRDQAFRDKILHQHRS